MPILAAFKSLFSKPKPKKIVTLVPLIDPRFEHPAYKNIPEDIIRALGDPSHVRNPPYQEGYYGLISGEYCMRTFQARLMGKLKRQSGLSPEEYKNYLEPILVAYAELCHLLPASEHHHHNTPGGLLRHGLEVACFMLDWMVLTKFDYELTPGAASKRLRRWYVAGITAALFHDAGKPLTDVRVTTFEGDKEYIPGPRTIHEWCCQHNITRYFITWVADRKDKHQRETTRLIGQYVTPEIHEWLLEGGKDIFDALLCATNGEPGPLTEAVKNADRQSVKADRARNGQGGNELTTGVPVQRLCVDAMRTLVEKGAWTFNEPGARIWNTPDGLFIGWAQGCEDIINEVSKDGVGGFPRSEISLMTMMIQREIIVENTDGSGIWHVAPHPLQRNGKSPSIRCVKIKNPDAVFAFALPAIGVISATIGRDANAKEFLTAEDKKQREALRVQAGNSSQLDLLNAEAGHPQDAEAGQDAGVKRKTKKKNLLTLPLPEGPVGASLPPEMAAMAEQLKQGLSPATVPATEPPEEPIQQSKFASAEVEEPKPGEDLPIKLDDISDDMLNSMLLDISGVHAPDTTALTNQPLPDAGQDPAPEEDEQSEAASALLKKLSQKGLKLNIHDLMDMKPVQVKKETRAVQDLNEASVNPKQQKSKSEPHLKKQLSASAGALVIPEPFAGLLSDEDETLLSVNPELGSKLLHAFSIITKPSNIRDRLFVPTQDVLSELEVEQMADAGWCWTNFFDGQEGVLTTVRDQLGFTVSLPLTLMYYRLTNTHKGEILDIALSDGFSTLVQKAKLPILESAIPEPSRGDNIYSLTYYVRDGLMKNHNLTLAEIEAVIAYSVGAIKFWREKKYYFQSEGED